MNHQKTAAGTDYDVVVVGAGAAGLAVIASLLKRQPKLHIALVEPATEHYYQPGWTLVGGGVFEQKSTIRPMQELIPAGVSWYRSAAASFLPEQNQIQLTDNNSLEYRSLIVATG